MKKYVCTVCATEIMTASKTESTHCKCGNIAMQNSKVQDRMENIRANVKNKFKKYEGVI